MPPRTANHVAVDIDVLRPADRAFVLAEARRLAVAFLEDTDSPLGRRGNPSISTPVRLNLETVAAARFSEAFTVQNAVRHTRPEATALAHATDRASTAVDLVLGQLAITEGMRKEHD